MAVPADRQNYALQTIFSFFLGLMVVAFIGIGVNTFYESPQEEDQKDIQRLERRMEPYNMKQPGNLTPAEEAERQRLQTQLDEMYRRQQEAMRSWSRNTSIILMLFATGVMGVSLVRSEQLRVISNGLLLGGLFTMVYGVILVIQSGNSIARFLVILFAFAVTLALGYLKFVRGRAEGPATVVSGEAGVASGAGFAELSRRMDALEARTAAAAEALGSQPRD